MKIGRILVGVGIGFIMFGAISDSPSTAGFTKTGRR